MSHGGGGEEGEESSERWLVSYADFITLLMVLFVVLYSMGQIDVEKYKRLADSMRTAFSVGGSAEVVDTDINASPGTSKDGSPKPIVVPGIPEGPPAAEEVAGQLTQILAAQNLGSEVSIQTNIEGVLISLSEKLVFEPGTVEIPEDVYPVLDTIAEMIRPINNKVRLVGHTDDTPSTDPRYSTNLELSVARSVAVANYLINSGIDSDRLVVSGRGSAEPVFDDEGSELKRLNSRVEIVIIYNVEENVVGVGNVGINP